MTLEELQEVNHTIKEIKRANGTLAMIEEHGIQISTVGTPLKEYLDVEVFRQRVVDDVIEHRDNLIARLSALGMDVTPEGLK